MGSVFSKRMERLSTKLANITSVISEETFTPQPRYYCTVGNHYPASSQLHLSKKGNLCCSIHKLRVRASKPRPYEHFRGRQFPFGVSPEIAIASKFGLDPWTLKKWKANI